MHKNELHVGCSPTRITCAVQLSERHSEYRWRTKFYQLFPAKSGAYDCGMTFARLLLFLVVAALTYYAASFIQMLFHRLFGHTRQVERLYDVHVRGHHAQYSGDMLSDRWIPTEQHTLWFYAIPFVPMSIAALWFLPIDIFLAHIGGLLFAIWWHVYLHRQYHIRDSWLNRFAWFQTKRRLHIIHHRKPHNNYAIVEYLWDRLLGTFDEGNRLCSAHEGSSRKRDGRKMRAEK